MYLFAWAKSSGELSSAKEEMVDGGSNFYTQPLSTISDTVR